MLGSLAVLAACGDAGDHFLEFRKNPANYPTSSPTASAHPTSSPTTSGLAYVANASANTITAYAPGASTPAQRITNSVVAPVAVAVDSSGNLYVDNCSDCTAGQTGTSTITVYARNASVPSRVITAGLNDPRAIAVDSNGNLYVANYSASNVTVYARGATTPTRTIATGIASPTFVSTDAYNNLYVVDTASGQTLVAVFTAGASSPVRLLGAPGATYAVADSTGNVYVAECSATCGGASADAIAVFAANSTNVKYVITTGVSAPGELALDASNNLYVTNGAGGSQNNVVEFGAGAATLIATILAPAPTAIAIDANGIVYVTTSSYLLEYHNGSRTIVTSGIDNPVAVATSTTPSP